jgi:hypothetical protein
MCPVACRDTAGDGAVGSLHGIDEDYGKEFQILVQFMDAQTLHDQLVLYLRTVGGLGVKAAAAK